MKCRLSADASCSATELSCADINLNDAYDKLGMVMDLVDNGDWTGESKDVLYDLLKLCKKFHGELLPVSEDIKSAVKDLASDASDFMSDSDIVKEWKE